MFAKPFKTKAYNPLKGSARKTLVQKIQSVYPNLKEDDLKELVPLKAALSSMKLTNSAGEDMSLHIVDNIPIMIEMQDSLCPTVYAIWRCPHIVPTLTIYDTAASRFQDGIYHVSRGHLFIPPRGMRLPQFKKGSIVSINMTNNKAAILVGTAVYSTGDLPQVQRGQCVKTIQMFGDLLCRHEKFAKVDRPNLGPPFVSTEETNNITDDLSKIELSGDSESKENIQDSRNDENSEPSENTSLFRATTPTTENFHEEVSEVDENGFPINMDDLLKYCLLSVIKTQGKKMVLPLKTNLLYANEMTTFCPPDRPLDVKKSSHKKMGKFLEAMEKEGIIQVKPIEKGVDAVVGVDFNHPSVKEHAVLLVPEGDGGKKKNDDGPSFSAPVVKEMYKITAAVCPFFEPLNFKRGQAVSASQVTNSLVSYVRRNELQDPVNKNLVKIDYILAQITSANVLTVTVTWEELKASTLKKMTHCTEMTFADGSSTINTGKLPIITMQIANRSGNKKVTIVSNVHYYGISLTALSKECQHGVAASSTITKSAGSKFDQLLVQGNQTYFLAKHLTEFYGLPKRFIEGADKILAKKKK